jgi:hypothetical protein
MPTQRVARYVMLFQELQHSVSNDTITSDAVRVALQMAKKIATICNNRQQPSAFS